MPRIQAAFVCRSFQRESGGLLTFIGVVQSVRLPTVPANVTEAALGILITNLPNDKTTTLEIALLTENGFIPLDGKLRASITIPPNEDGFAQIAYNIKAFVIPKYGDYRFVFFFDGSNDAIHYAPLVVRPLATPEEDLPAWVKPTRH